MTKQNALNEMKKFEDRLPTGAKAKIARGLRMKTRYNVYTVFRGIASEKLTLRVYRKAKELFPVETEIKVRKMNRAKTKSQ